MGRLASRLGSLRRRAEPDARPPSGTERAAALVQAGWLLPRPASDPGGPRWTWLGTVGSDAAAAVDGAGVVSVGGWSLDWWIGAEDRWHLPTAEASIRQTLLGGTPGTETAMRVPGGDAIHRAYAVRAGDGRDAVVVEVENRSHVPFAVALVIRPFDLVGAGGVDEVTIEPTTGGVGRDEAHVVRIDGGAGLLLPRRPNRWAAADGTDRDIVDVVTTGDAGTELASSRSTAGLATAAAVLPLAHTAVLRVLVPMDLADRDGLPAVPPLDAVVAGWEAQDRGARLVVPDPRLAEALEASRRHLLLAADGPTGRAGARSGAAVDDEVTPLVSGALADLDRADLLAGPPEGAEVPPSAPPDVTAHPTAVMAGATRLRRAGAATHDGTGDRVGDVVEDLAAAAEVLGRDVRRNREPDPRAVSLIAADGVDDLAAVLAGSQPDASSALHSLVLALRERGLAASARKATSAGDAEPPSARRRFVEAGLAARNGDGARAFSLLADVLDDGTATWTWPAPPGAGRLGDAGHDRAANAGLVRAVRSLLVRDESDGLALLPVFTDGWYGGGIEVHDVPTDWGRLSYGVRWHGQRPALLWDVEPWDPSAPPIRLTVPGLDPSWSSTERRGEALLGEVAPPVDLDPLRVIAEHPDLDPAMRRPGDAPTDTAWREPEAGGGGSFS